jgi:RNA polymerase primary sigma factor
MREAQKLQAQLGREATREELADATKLPLNHVDEALDAAAANVSLNQQVGNDGDGELGDMFADTTSDDPSEYAADALRRRSIREAVERLPERQRAVIALRFGLDGEPQSLEAIGKELSLTRERIRQLEADALDRLQLELAGVADELANAA